MSYNQYDDNINIAILTSEITNNTNSMLDVTGLFLPMMADTSYEFEFEVIWRCSDVTRCVRLSANGPASPTLVIIHTEIPQTLSSVSYNLQRSYNTNAGPTATDTANANCYARCYGNIINGPTAGDLILRFTKSGGAGVVVAIEPGSIMRMWRTNPSN